MSTGRLLGRHALVTGASGGLGRACVAALVAEGAQVIATDLDDKGFLHLESEEDLAGVDWRVLDVADDSKVREFANAVDQLDILVNCAGVLSRGEESFNEEHFDWVVDINLHGTMRCCRAFLPHLKARPGTIVNIASMMSFLGTGTAPGYAASKGGVAQLTKSLAIAWGEYGIRVNAIAPGWIKTPMSGALPPDYVERVKQRTPLGAWGRPEHIGRVVPLLCDDAAAWINGVILPVDGGYLAA